MASMSRVTVALLAAAALGLTLGLGACGTDSGTSPDAGPARHSGSSAAATPATVTPTPTPTPTTTQSAGTTARHKVGTLGPRSRAAADAHLIAADRLPVIGGRAWALGTSGPEEPDAGAVGPCQKTALGTLGAVEATRRTFTAPDGLTATQVVGRFADSRSAWRAHEVLTSWRDDCESRVARATVGPLRPVTVHAGSADSYRASFGTRPRASGLGILRTGSYLTLVEVTAGGDRYPTAWDPARVAVRRIARTF